MMRWICTALTTLVLVLAARAGRAQGNVAAEALFEDGRALYEQGKYAEGCPKLAESHRLDPATGTLLALALCHEGEGRLATAWAEFREAEGRARREGRADRESIATERAAALRPRLSTLAVDVPGELAKTPGLEVRVDGVVVGASSFGVAMPVDGGVHRVDAVAPGKVAWQGAITVKAEVESVRVVVPALASASPEKAAKPDPVPAPPPAAEPKERPESGAGMRMAGIVTAGAGVVLLGVGGYLALDAKADYERAKENCGGPDSLDCPAGPLADIRSARSQGTAATIVLVVGGAALATGAVVWFLAPSGGEASPPAAGRVRIERVGVGLEGVTLRGSF